MRAHGRGWTRSPGVVRLAPLMAVGGLALLALAAFAPVGPAQADGEEPVPVWTPHASGLEVVDISSIRIHPRAPDVVWAYVRGLGVVRSTDGGGNWEVRHEGIDERHVPGPRDPCSISLDPRDEKMIWLAVKGQVYRSEDAGDTWENRTTGALHSWSWDRSGSVTAIRGIVVDPKKSLHIFAGTRTEGSHRGGLFESTDSGKIWEQIAGNDVDKSELGHDAWPIVLDPRTDKNVAVGGSNGFWFSDDRGRRFRRADPGAIGWHDVRALTPLTSRNREIHLCDGRGLWTSRDGGKRWDRKPHLAGDCVTAALDPHARRRLYAVLRDKGLLVSEDPRHMKWEEMGHADLDLHEVFMHPRDKEQLYAASPTTGLHLSNDQGTVFASVQGNVQPIVPPIVAAVIHPVDADRAMALSDHGAIFLSSDRGETWERAGRLGMVPTLLVGDPEAGATWWAAGRELLRSPDNGGTWTSVYKPDDPEDRILDFKQLADGALWLLLERSRVLAHSEDAGKTWATTKPPTRTPGSWATSFDVDTTNPDHLLLATRSLAHLWTPKDGEGGAWESWDGGKSWKSLKEGLLEDDKPLRDWNRGRIAAIDATTGLLFYAADGLGLFARLAANPKGEKPVISPAWIDISPPIPELSVEAFLLRPLPDDGGVQLIVQAEGENDTRTFVRTTTARVLTNVNLAPVAGDPGPPLWDEMPDPPARLAWLGADPHVEGRLLGSDVRGTAGVLAFGVPGARPEVPEVPAGEGPAPAGEVAGPVPPEGLLGFTAGADAQVRVWALAEGKVLSSLPGHMKEVIAVALAPDESVLATGGADKSVLLFDGTNGTLRDIKLPAEKYDSTINGLAFHPDSELLFVAMQQSWSLVEWNVKTGASKAYDAHTAGVTCVAVMPDGKQVFSGSRDRTVRCWDIATASTLFKIDVGEEVISLAISPDAKRVYVGARGAAVRCYDATTGEEVAKTDAHTAYVTDLALSPDGSLLYAAGDRGVVVLSTEKLEVQGTPLEGPSSAVFCVVLSKDGQWVVAGDAANGIWMWHAGEKKPWWYNTSAHVGSVHDVVLTPDVPEGAAPAEEQPDEAPDEGAMGEGDPAPPEEGEEDPMNPAPPDDPAPPDEEG